MISPTAAVRRGFDNALANWPLLLIRIAENVAIVVVILLPILAVAVPIAVYGASSGLFDTLMGVQSVEDFLGLPMLLMFLAFLIVLAIVIGLAMIVHSFVEGGAIGCYIDADRAAGDADVAPRARFRVFTPDRWFRHAKRTWWPVFLIYNVTWGLFGLLLLIPVMILAVVVFLLRERPEVIVLPILGLVALLFFGILIGIVVQLWSTASVVLSVNGRTVGQALREGWRVLFSRFLPIALLVVIAFVIHGAVGGTIAVASIGVSFVAALPDVGMFMIPLQIAISLLQTAISLAVAAWFLAAFVSVVIR